jgi:hypothetical protein
MRAWAARQVSYRWPYRQGLGVAAGPLIRIEGCSQLLEMKWLIAAVVFHPTKRETLAAAWPRPAFPPPKQMIDYAGAL